MKLRIFLAVMVLTPALFVAGCSSDGDNGITADTNPPLAPVVLGARGDDGLVGVWWQSNAEADLDGYNVYLIQGGTVTRMNNGTIEGNSYVERVSVGGSAQVYVTAVDYTGNESSPSATKAVKLTLQDRIEDSADIDNKVDDAHR